MELVRLTAEEYASQFAHTPSVYSGASFCTLNVPNAEEVAWVGARDSKMRLGIALGLRDGIWRSHWSAPFGGFVYNRPQPSQVVADAVEALVQRFGHVQLTLAPAPYSDPHATAAAYAMLMRGARQEQVLNYHHDLAAYGDYVQQLAPNARRYLRQACGVGFNFVRADTNTPGALERVYSIIAANRREQGYPLAMTLEQVRATVSGAVKADLFLLTLDGADAASALVYRASFSVAQVIYWGDLAHMRHLQPMSLLTQRIFEYYRKLGYMAVDAGPAGDFTATNPGLAAFKERILCSPSLKLRLTL